MMCWAREESISDLITGLNCNWRHTMFKYWNAFWIIFNGEDSHGGKFPTVVFPCEGFLLAYTDQIKGKRTCFSHLLIHWSCFLCNRQAISLIMLIVGWSETVSLGSKAEKCKGDAPFWRKWSSRGGSSTQGHSQRKDKTFFSKNIEILFAHFSLKLRTVRH